MTTPTACVAAETIRAYIASTIEPPREITGLLESVYPGQTATIETAYWSALCRYSLAQTGYAPEDVLEALILAAPASEAPEEFTGHRIDWADAWDKSWRTVGEALRADFIPGQSTPTEPVDPDLRDYIRVD